MRFAPAAEALAYLCWCTSWNGGYAPVYLNASPVAHTWLKAGGLAAAIERGCKRWDARDSAQVELGLPHGEPGLSIGSSTVLWAWVESREAAQRAARFRPVPAVVLRMGSSCRRLCFWPLQEAVPWIVLEHANKRLAYALHAPQKYAAAEKLRIPLPGTFLRAGRSRPAPVVATRLELETFTHEQVAGRLKAPPAPYLQRVREGRVTR